MNPQLKTTNLFMIIFIIQMFLIMRNDIQMQVNLLITNFLILKKLLSGLEKAHLKMLNYLKVDSDTVSYYPSSLIFLFNELVTAGFFKYFRY